MSRKRIRVLIRIPRKVGVLGLLEWRPLTYYSVSRFSLRGVL